MRFIKTHPVLDIPEKKEVPFTCNGRTCIACEGDPVSSALIANGIHIFSYHPRNHQSQGIFCANGQCSHCTVLIDGIPLKSCITPLKANMDIRTLDGIPELPEKDKMPGKAKALRYNCDVLIAGGGPSGLTAALELADAGFSVLLADDKEKLGGKLLLQTHKFFGSTEDCYAGTRGHEIAKLLAEKVRTHPNIRVLSNTIVAGIYKDRKAGLFVNNRSYALVDFRGLLVSAGARERSLVFPGNALPGIFGAGAFQTLVNRDGVKVADSIFIVGSGNVGLIAAYHALQAGICVKGICDILPQPGGYKVHADKIRRMGVPIYLRHTILSAEGDEKLKRVTIAEVNEMNDPLLNTAKTFDVDTLLIAVGLAPIDEFYTMAQSFGFPVLKAGDAEEIAEASSAMFGGRIAGLQMANLLGKNIRIDDALNEKVRVLKSPPGKIYPPQSVSLNENFRPLIHCLQEIPCNPCVSICPVNAIQLHPRLGNILDIPEYTGNCTGCMQCVAICPGLAITLARKRDARHAELVLPYEFIPDFSPGDTLPLTDIDENVLESGIVLKIRFHKKTRTTLITLKVSLKNASRIAGIRIQPETAVRPARDTSYSCLPDNAYVCHCEMVTVGEIRKFITEHAVHDLNQLKVLRVGMGSCGGRNCALLLPKIFREMGIPPEEVTPSSKRPLSVEIPMQALINEDTEATEESPC
ncbi:MAG: 2Fe-2S iron-sulfur cluster-binding protein [Candidatus Neomarinimicrobiota bacterium]|nr:FAD-dependent oxidoreductase [Candidatus Neomarinimicrobiota bacterium]MDD3966921.1 FAD-dependent oxidoreductase [Candidatus Neomarinimicrobiota bacterium]MDX9779943.1 FAD-dependent oxidoreductase [bacterium]